MRGAAVRSESVRAWGHVLMCLFGLGCGLQPYTSDSGDGGSTGGGASTGDATLGGSVTGAGTAVTTGMVEGTGEGSTTGEESTTDAVETCGMPQETGGTKACDVWTQDCPEGCKCMPYSGDGDSAWESLKCVPVMPNAGGHGDACTVEGNGVSGIDSCAEGYMCWDVDPETGMGHCVEQCKGTPFEPYCTDEWDHCLTAAEGVLTLCLPGCHPLEQACPNRDLCVPNPMEPNSFICVIDGSGEEGQVFDVCEYANACDPGLLCANVLLAEECDQAAAGCCLPFCDLDAPSCPGVGQECLAWYEEGQAPSKLADVGVCGIPQ
jgi:hypothetical protein